MILEITWFLNENDVLLASWQFEEIIWNEKKKILKDLIKTTIKSYAGDYNISESTENTNFKIIGKPNIFFNTQNRLNEYFELLNVEKLIQ